MGGQAWRLPVGALRPEQGFGCLGSFVYLYACASTEQGLPARRPCTRALWVPRLIIARSRGFPRYVSGLAGRPRRAPGAAGPFAGVLPAHPALRLHSAMI